MTRTYLDHNATAPLRPVARRAMLDALGRPGNASSVHAEGRAARAHIEDAREKVAALVGGKARNVIFTSGATEALALALRPHWRKGGEAAPTRALISATEHVAALEGHGFGDAMLRAPVDGLGRVDLGAVESRYIGETEKNLTLVFQAANNETGVLLSDEAVALFGRLRRAGDIFVCDAVQAAGRIACTFETTGADMLIVSSHKIGGPQGAGALILRDSALHCAKPLIRGGGQERGFRAGTENVAAIAGFGAAAAEAATQVAEEGPRLLALRDDFEAALLRIAPDAAIFGKTAPRLPNTCAFALPGVSAETLLMAFDIAGVALSSGSACSSGKVKRSHVLDAMGVSADVAKGALRASFGWSSTPADVAVFAAALQDILTRIRANRAKT